MSLRVITRPNLEPVTVDDVKLHTRIDSDIEDSLLQTWITSAREQAEDFQRRAYISQVLELSFDEFPKLPLSLPRCPVISIESISYIDYQNNVVTMALTDFILDTDSEPARIDHAYSKSWPCVTLRSINSVKIRYTAGYGATAESVPEKVKDAIMLYCAWKNENRTAEDKFPEQFFNILRPDRMYT